MAKRQFYFPDNVINNQFHTAYGDMGIVIWRTELSNNNHDTKVIPTKISPLDFQFEVDPSAQTFRFTSATFTFPNLNNIFESPNEILNDTYEFETFIDIYFGTTRFWRGIVDFESIKKADWYNDSGTLKYRKISFKAFDALAYFWWNSDTLSTAGFSANDDMETVLEDILALIDVSASDIVFDSNIKITESNGNEYNLADFRVKTYVTSTPCSTFLKDFMLAFCAYIYSWNGKYYVVKRTGGTTKTITTDYLKKAEKISEDKPIKYVKVEATRNWGSASDQGDYTHDKEHGDSTVDTNEKFIIDKSDLLKQIFINFGTASDYPLLAVRNPPTSSTTTTLTDTGANGAFLTNDIESGMTVNFGITPGPGPQMREQPVLDVQSEQTAEHIYYSTAPRTDVDYYFEKNPGGVDDLYKVEFSVRAAADGYNEYFMTSYENLKLQLRGISEFINIHYRFVFNSVNYRVKKARIDFTKDDMIITLKQVS